MLLIDLNADPGPVRAGSGEPVPARPAATVILTRPAERGFEVLMVRRLAAASSFADVFVFPGGGVRSDDYEVDSVAIGLSAAEAFSRLTERGGTAPSDAGSALAMYRAAVRELFEEAGILLARDMMDTFPRLVDDPERWTSHRQRLQTELTSLIDVLRAERLIPADRQLVFFSHWVAPFSLPRRFDTRFFIGELPDGQSAAHCQVETTESLWISPKEALERADLGLLPLVLPTRLHLRRLLPFATQADLLDYARAKQIVTIQPTMNPSGSGGHPEAQIEDAAW